MTKRKQSETSKAAYDSLQPDDIREMYRTIMITLSAIGMGTFEEIAAHAKVERERVWKRLSEMERMELIYRPGNKRVLRSGRQGYCWALTGQHLPKTEANERALKGKGIADYSREINDISKAVQSKMF